MRRVLLVILAITAAVAAGASPAVAATPHEDPDSAIWVFDGVSLLKKYSEVTDAILSANATRVRLLQEQAPNANIPTQLRDVADRFLTSSHSLAGLIFEVQSDLETSRKMLEQLRADEARASAAAASTKLTQAYTQLEVVEREARSTGRWWKADSARQGSALGTAYQTLLDKLAQLRRMLGLLGEVSSNLEQQSATAAIPRRPTALSLRIDPPSAFVGDQLEFAGELSSQGRALSGRKVVVLLGGAPVAEETTDSRGTYRGRLTLPYRYVPVMTLQAIYYPRGDDINLNLGSSSPEIAVKVLYYATTLGLEVPKNAYPGRPLALKGHLSYAGNVALQARNLQVNWNESQVAEKTVAATAFAVEIEVDPEAKPGKHRLGVYVSADKRYGPADASIDLEVVKLVPAIEFTAPPVLLLPLAKDLQGRAYSSLGPLRQASIRVSLGNWETTTRTEDDGSFQAHLGTGLSLSVVGGEVLKVSVAPAEPWHQGHSSTLKVVVVNLVNVSGLFIALAASLWMGIRQWRRRPTRAATPPVPQPSPVRVARESSPLPSEQLNSEALGSPQTILLTLYRGVLRLVQELTAVLLTRNQTLREYAQECAQKLGPLATYFQEFTAIMERALYARQRPDQADAVRGIKLSRQLVEGAQDENS